MNNREQIIKRLNYIINHYKQNPPKNDKEEKQLREANKNLAKFQQLELEF